MNLIENIVLIGQLGDVLISKSLRGNYFRDLELEKVDEDYLRVIGIPEMRDIYKLPQSLIFSTMEGDIFLVDNDHPNGILLRTGLPPIKQIINILPMGVVDITDTLSFPDLNEIIDANSNNRKIDHNFNKVSEPPIEDIKTVVVMNENVIILTYDDTVLYGKPGSLSVLDYRGPIDNIYPGIMVDSGGIINRMFINANNNPIILGISEADYKIDDCIAKILNAYLISNGTLRRLDLIVEVNEYNQAQVINSPHYFVRFVDIGIWSLIEDREGNLYYSHNLEYYSCPVRLMNLKNTPVKLPTRKKNPRTRLE